MEKFGKDIDLLVTDVVMPQLSGPELATRLMLMQPKMKVLFISGYLDEMLDSFDLVKDRVAFLQKPFTADTLLQKIQKIMSEKN